MIHPELIEEMSTQIIIIGYFLLVASLLIGVALSIPCRKKNKKAISDLRDILNQKGIRTFDDKKKHGSIQTYVNFSQGVLMTDKAVSADFQFEGTKAVAHVVVDTNKDGVPLAKVTVELELTQIPAEVYDALKAKKEAALQA